MVSPAWTSCRAASRSETLPEARGEVNRAVNILRYFGGEGARLTGEIAPSERDRVVIHTLRRPLGVVAESAGATGTQGAHRLADFGILVLPALQTAPGQFGFGDVALMLQ